MYVYFIKREESMLSKVGFKMDKVPLDLSILNLCVYPLITCSGIKKNFRRNMSSWYFVKTHTKNSLINNGYIRTV